MRRALFALTVAGLTWGLTVPLSKVVLGWLDPAWTTVGRFGLAAPVLALLARGRLREAATPAVAAWGAVGFGAVIVLQNVGIQRTSVTHAAVILGAVPVLVALAAAAIGSRASGPAAWFGFMLALGGIGLVAGTGGGSSLTGDGLILVSAVLSAATIVAQTRLLKGRDPIAVTAIQMAGAALTTLPLALFAGNAAPTTLPTTGQALAAVALVTVGSLVPFSLYAYGQARVRAEVAGAFVNLEPLVGAALGAVVFGDPFGQASLAGGLAVVAGIALSASPARPQAVDRDRRRAVVGDAVDGPASPGRGEEVRREGTAGIGDPGLAAVGHDPGQDPQQLRPVAALVEHVGTDDEVAGHPEPAGWLRPRPAPCREANAVRGRVAFEQLDRGRGPVRRQHVAAGPGRDERRDAKSAAELVHVASAHAHADERVGEREGARPQLGPVGQELLVLEGVLVEQDVRVARPQDIQADPAHGDPLAHEVQRAVHLRVLPSRVMPSRSRRLVTFLVLAAVGVAGCGSASEGGGSSSGGGGGGGGDAAAAKKPKALFAGACGSCHTLSAAGTNGSFGPNLDELKPNRARVQAAIANGPGAMPANLYAGDDAIAVAKYVAANAGQG